MLTLAIVLACVWGLGVVIFGGRMAALADPEYDRGPAVMGPLVSTVIVWPLTVVCIIVAVAFHRVGAKKRWRERDKGDLRAIQADAIITPYPPTSGVYPKPV